jgi:hypothetical protein
MTTVLAFVLVWLAVSVLAAWAHHRLRMRRRRPGIPRVVYLGWSGSLWRERR